MHTHTHTYIYIYIPYKVSPGNHHCGRWWIAAKEVSVTSTPSVWHPQKGKSSLGCCGELGPHGGDMSESWAGLGVMITLEGLDKFHTSFVEHLETPGA